MKARQLNFYPSRRKLPGEAEMLAPLDVNPFDTQGWLVYADWLADHSQEDHEGFIRRWLALAVLVTKLVIVNQPEMVVLSNKTVSIPSDVLGTGTPWVEVVWTSDMRVTLYCSFSERNCTRLAWRTAEKPRSMLRAVGTLFHGYELSVKPVSRKE